MKRSTVLTFLAGLSLIQSTAHGALVDLPDPSSTSEGTSSQREVPIQSPVQQQEQGYASVLQIKAMSRVSGGATYRVTLKQSLSLINLEITQKSFRTKLNKVSLITDSGTTISVKNMSKGQILKASEVVASEKLNQSDRVKSILIQAESYDGAGNLDLKVVADRDVPIMSVAVIPATPVKKEEPKRSAPVAEQGIRAGALTMVWYQNRYQEGRIEAVFENEKAAVKINNEIVIFSLPQLFSRLNSAQGFTVGEAVMVYHRVKAGGTKISKLKINNIYRGSGAAYPIATVTVEDETVFVAVSSDVMFKATGCNKAGYCVGQRALYKSGYNFYVVKVVGHSDEYAAIESTAGNISSTSLVNLSKEKK